MKLYKFLLLLTVLMLTHLTNAQYIKYGYHEAVIKMYDDSANLINGADTRYDVMYKAFIADNYENLVDTNDANYYKLTNSWFDVTSPLKIKFSMGPHFISNARYVLKVRDNTNQQTMTIKSSGDIDSVRFTPGDYEIQDPFLQLFKIKPDSGVTITNQDIAHHTVGKKHKYAILEESFDSKDAFNLWPVHLKHAEKVLVFSSVDGVMWISDRQGLHWQKSTISTAIIRGAYELDKGRFYMLVDDTQDKDPIDRLLVFDHYTKKYDAVVLPKNDVYHPAAIKMLDRNTIVAFYSKHGKPADNIMYKSIDGGKTWEVKHYYVIKRQLTNYFILDMYYDGNNPNPIAMGVGTQIIKYDAKGELQTPEKVDYIPNLHQPIAHNGSTGGERLVAVGDSIYRIFNGFKGIRGNTVLFNNNIGAIVNGHYILITTNVGLSWKYYPYENVRSEGGIGNIDVTKGPQIQIRDAILLPNNLLILSAADKVYKLDLNKIMYE